MKKLFSLAVAVVMLLSVMGIFVSADRGLEYTAAYATPKIDGVADEVWADAEWADVDLKFAGGNDTDCSLRVKILHDDKYLYFLAEVTDATPNAGDAVEFYIDEDYCGDSAYCDNATQLSILLDGTAKKNSDSASKSEADAVVESACKEENGVYVLEWAFKPIGGMTDEMGLEFMYNDCNESGAFLMAYRWNVDTANGDAPPFQSLASFGKLILAEAPAESATETTAPAESATETTAPAESETETTAPAESETETAAPAESETETTAPAESETETAAPAESETETTAPAESETEAPETTTPAAPQTSDASMIIAVALMASACVAVAFSKKH